MWQPEGSGILETNARMGVALYFMLTTMSVQHIIRCSFAKTGRRLADCCNLQGNDILIALYLRQLCAYAIAGSSGAIASYDESHNGYRRRVGDFKALLGW